MRKWSPAVRGYVHEGEGTYWICWVNCILHHLDPVYSAECVQNKFTITNVMCHKNINSWILEKLFFLQVKKSLLSLCITPNVISFGDSTKEVAQRRKQQSVDQVQIWLIRMQIKNDRALVQVKYLWNNNVEADPSSSSLYRSDEDVNEFFCISWTH